MCYNFSGVYKEMKIDDVFFDILPKIDLHGFDRDSAKVATDDFVDEAIKMNYESVIIIHGIGEGIVKKAVHEALSRNKDVLSFHVLGENIGCTIVYLDRSN